MRRAALALLALLPLPALADRAPLFLSNPDGSLDFTTIEVQGLPGLVYGCFGEKASMARLVCIVIRQDGTAVVYRVVRREKTT